MVDRADRRPRGLAECYVPRKVNLFFKLKEHTSYWYWWRNCLIHTQQKTCPHVCLCRNGSRGVQCLLLFTGVPGHPGDGLFHQEAEVPGGPGIQLQGVFPPASSPHSFTLLVSYRIALQFTPFIYTRLSIYALELMIHTHNLMSLLVGTMMQRPSQNLKSYFLFVLFLLCITCPRLVRAYIMFPEVFDVIGSSLDLCGVNQVKIPILKYETYSGNRSNLLWRDQT